MGKTPEELFQEREKRVHDAVLLREPDRVPVMCHSGFFPAHYAGITCEAAMYDRDKVIAAWTKFLEDFEPDMVDNPFSTRFLGPVLETLDYKQLKWAGHGLGRNASYQFLEDEYMRDDEYDQFLYDPTDFVIRSYWPRIFGALKPFESVPPLRYIVAYYMGLGEFAAFGSPPMVKALEALTEAAKRAQEMAEGARVWAARSKALGFPLQAGALTQAPFDTLSDFFRGTRGAMLDLFRRPDKVLAMTEKLLPMMLGLGLTAKVRGIPRVFIPVHKGLDGFMSQDQFKIFYWPTLKMLIEGLIEENCTPIVFWEGEVTSRLETIGDIPRGKAVYALERTDLLRAKEVLGNQVCVKGGVPVSLLITGTPDEVRGYCRKLIEVAGKGGGFIMDTSTVIDDARTENVKAMFDVTKEYRVYS
ncbi:MAG: uroporphyrinogen decarboxylase family protein [Thermodesulfobacteriota bacterium]